MASCKEYCKECIHNDICDLQKFIIENRDSCEHFKDRTRFVELPCKVGDTVYYITGLSRKYIYVMIVTKAYTLLLKVKGVKTMAKEYIERKSLISDIKELPEQERIEYMGIYDCIKSQPTADVQEVRHGEWQCCDNNNNTIYNDWYCSECGYYSDIRNKNRLGNYCSNCGAKMDRGEQNAL